MRNKLNWLFLVIIFSFFTGEIVANETIDYLRFDSRANALHLDRWYYLPPPCPNPPTISSIDVTNTTCGSTGGSITINMQGAGTYAFQWSPNLSTNNTMSGLVAGLYRVTVTDNSVADCAVDTFVIVQNSNGPDAYIVSTSPTVCMSSNGQATLGPSSLDFQWDDLVTSDSRDNLTNRTYAVTATDPATSCYSVLAVTIGSTNPLSSSVAIDEPATCNQSNGSATATVVGGTGDYSYSWGISSQTSTLPLGDYGLQIVDNGNGCIDSVYFTMPGAASVGSVSLASVESSSCNGGSDGTANFDVQEGFPFGEPSSVLIKDPSGLVHTNGFLSAGSYTAYLLDVGGCTVDSTVLQMTENTSLLAVPNVIAQTCTVGGIITLDVTGGVPPYTYDWADLPGTDDPKDRIDLVSGFYSVTIHDDLGCQFVLDVVNVGNECGSGACTNPVIITDLFIEQSVCGNFSGSAKFLINGDPVDYTWAWAPEDGVLIEPGNERQSLGVGSYAVTVTDNLNNACFTSKSFAITNSNGPQATVVATTPVTCNGTNGSAQLAPDTYTYTWADGSHLAERTDLLGGYHYVTVSDGTCDNVVSVYIDESSTLDASITINNEPACDMNDGSVTISVSNGSGSYSYDWGAGATHNGLAAGNYEVYVQDLQSGCDTTLNFELNNAVGGATVTINGDVFTSCAGTHDGTVDFDVAYDADFTLPATVEILNHADSVITNGELFVGPHCVVVKDGNGCIAGQGCFYVNAPLAINADVAVTPVTCDNLGAINLTVVGGEGGYTFDWQDLAGTNDPEDRVNIGTGSYSVTITDGFGCEAAQSGINVPDLCGCDVLAGTITADSTDICDQKPNMVISATAGGDAFVPNGYVTKYLLTKASNDAVYQIMDLPVFTITGSGTFVIHTFIFDPLVFDLSTINFGETTVFDINNQLIQGGGLICAALDVSGAEILINKCTTCNLPLPSASVVDAHCGILDGSIQLIYAQDTTGFTYQWSPEVSNDSQVENVEAGAYYVTVSEYGDDACATSITIVITNEDGPEVTIDSIAPTICTAVNGFLRLSPTNLDYLWENGAESYVRSSLTDTVYAIRATDPNTGCFSMLAVEIEKEDPLDATLEIISQPVCGLPNGHAKIIVEGGSDNYNYSWGNFEEKQDLPPGEYTVVVVDVEYGCTEVLPFEMVNSVHNLIEPDSLFLQSGNCDAPYPICLDLPASNAFGYVFTDNGLAYSGNIVACGTDTVNYYDASMFESGSYSVALEINDVNYAVIIESQQQLLDSLMTWDPFGGWVLENNRYVLTLSQGTHSDLLVIDNITGITTIVQLIGETIEQGVQLEFNLGEHNLYIHENATGCQDTLFASIECVPCPSIYSGPDTLFGGICEVDTGYICLDIPSNQIGHYIIRDNWEVYEGTYTECGVNQTQLALAQGGHTLIVTNTDTYCSDTLQIYVFCIPPADFVIETTLFEHDHIEVCLDNSILSGTPIYAEEMCQFLWQPLVSNDINYQTFCMDIGGLAIGHDTLCVKVCDDAGDCAMTYIYVDVLPRIDTVEAFVTLTGTKTICVDTTLFTGDIAFVENLCPESSGHEVGLSLLGNTGCMVISGLEVGVDTACIAVCDIFNHCDTTIFLLQSDVPKPDTMDIEMIIYADTMVCAYTGDLPGEVEIFSTICADEPGKAIFQVSQSSYCIQINAYEYGHDTLCLEFCDDTFCDTLVLAVNIIQDTTAMPIAEDDNVKAVLNRPVDFDILANDMTNGTVDSIKILIPARLGNVVINSDFTVTYTPQEDTCMVQDSFTYVLYNKNGTDNAVVYIEILCDEVTVYGALSPNNDGINDFLYIEGIDKYPDNQVFIFNRWGNEIFSRKGYTNDDPWNGLWKDIDLPVGTYYYVIDLGKASRKRYGGYIQISR